MKLDWIGYYKLTKENVDRYISVAAGIYRIAIELKNDNVKPVYVGQSNDLEERILQYVNKDTSNECLLKHLENHIPYFKVAEVSAQKDRDAGERALFDKYNPECNDPDKIPDVGPADINFN